MITESNYDKNNGKKFISCRSSRKNLLKTDKQVKNNDTMLKTSRDKRWVKSIF